MNNKKTMLIIIYNFSILTGVSELIPLAAKLIGAEAKDVIPFDVRQCLSYRIPNRTIKYSIRARNTNSVHDISHT